MLNRGYAHNDLQLTVTNIITLNGVKLNRDQQDYFAGISSNTWREVLYLATESERDD